MAQEKKKQGELPFYLDPTSTDELIAKAIQESLYYADDDGAKIRKNEQKKLEKQKKRVEREAQQKWKDEKEFQTEIKNELVKNINKNDASKFRIYLNETCGAGIDLSGFDLLHIAAEHNAYLIIPVLLKNTYKQVFKLNVDMLNKSGLTPLHVAVREGNFEAVEELIEFQAPKANINVFDKDGWTPLHFAAYNNNLKLVKYLVGKGADLELLTNKGETAIELAKKNSKVAMYLKEAIQPGKKQSSFAYSKNQAIWSSESSINNDVEKENNKTNPASPRNSYSSSEES